MKRGEVQVGLNKETPPSKIYYLEINEVVRRMYQKKEKNQRQPHTRLAT